MHAAYVGLEVSTAFDEARAALPWVDGMGWCIAGWEGALVVLVLSNASENKGCPVRREECTPITSVEK